MKIESTKEKASYALGSSIAESLIKDGLESIDRDIFFAGLTDALDGKSQLDVQEGRQALQAYFTEIQGQKGQKNLEAGKSFLTKNGLRPEVTTLPSGLQYEVMNTGTGPKPSASDTVTTHYHGTLINGNVFDSSVQRNSPASFPVNGVIPGWVEALQLMPVGSKWKLFVPSNLAYGEMGSQGAIGPNETLIFEVELLSIK